MTRRSSGSLRVATPVTRGTTALLVLLALSAACSSSQTGPATLDTKNEACAHCRMAVSDQRFAAQLVAPQEEPLFFDDIGCLRSYLDAHAQLAAGTVAYVADHRTRAWVAAARAVYRRHDKVETPMGSHILAFADAASRDADAGAAGGTDIGVADVFGPRGAPDGAK